MEDLVLTTRLDVLEKSLEQVRRIVTSVQERREDVGTLLKLLGSRGSIEDAVFRLRRDVDSSQVDLRILQDRVDDRDKEGVDRALKSLTRAGSEVMAVLDSLKEAKGVIDSMLMRSVPITEDTDLGDMLSNVLVEEAGNSIDKLQPIRDMLQEAKGADDHAKAKDLMQKAWAEYTGTVYPSSQPLLREYVDLLGGLALRETGFDAEICRLADELVRPWVPKLKVAWDSLTIPAYRESVTMTPARIIRLGFPEWTLWALPLTAHEFGHVAVSQGELLQKVIAHGEPDGRTKEHRQEYAADAIATYAMGPAYACAAILLRFDPLSAHTDHLSAYTNQDDLSAHAEQTYLEFQVAHAEQAHVMFQPAHAKRAHVVFGMLERMNQKDDQGPYRAIIDRLRKEWEAALGQAQPPGELQHTEIDELDEWLQDLWVHLDKRRGPMYSTQAWLEISDWPDKLLQNMGEDILVDGSEDLRDVLNAAWQCRVKHQTDIELIADAAWDVWKRISEKRDGDGPPGGGASPGIPRRPQ